MQATDFVSIRVSTLRGDLAIPFDVYVKVAGKYILYCRKGDSFEGTRLQRLKDKKLKKLFILEDTERAYRAYMTESIEKAYDSTSNKPIETRAQVIQGAQQAATEDVMDAPESKALYDVAKEGSRRYVDFVLRESNALKAILNLENSDQSISHHGVTVATIAIGMAEKLGFAESHPVNLLALGCQLHDVEHFHSGLNLARPRESMDRNELAVYQKHPFLGAERVQEAEHMDRIVLNIILQHEEYIDGSGFPKGLKESEMDPLTLVACTANSYDRYVSFEGLSPKESLRKILIEKVGLHPLDYLKALQGVLKEKGIIL